MKSKYMTPRGTRRWNKTNAGRCRAGYLYPVAVTPFFQSEGGIIEQTITKELDQVLGRMITEVTAEVYTVYVPLAGIAAVDGTYGSEPFAGTPEWMRDKLSDTSVPLFPLSHSTETPISKALGVKPRSVSGVKRVNEAVLYGHNLAVNFLRRQKYEKAAQVAFNNLSPTPAPPSSRGVGTKNQKV